MCPLIYRVFQDQYQTFYEVTQNALGNALKSHQEQLSREDIDAIMKAYDSLSTFPDVANTLSALKDSEDITVVVFSNGTAEMVSASVNKSDDLSPYASIFEELVVVHPVKKFKPHPSVYEHLARTMGKDPEKDMGSIWLVTANPFDIVGARAMGINAAWVDRDGKGWVDQLLHSEVGRPNVIVKRLDEVVEAVRRSS
jgi:2-haloacid dehalogenase